MSASNSHHHRQYKGVLSGLKARLEKNRLGELLVLEGFLSPQQLQYALSLSKSNGKRLGRVLVDENIVRSSAIRKTLAEQFMLRFMTAAATLFIAMTSMGFAKQARAGSIKDVPSLMQVANASFAPVRAYPKLFGSSEKKSTNLNAFTKWTGMFDRFDVALANSNNEKLIEDLRTKLTGFKDLPLHKMAVKVNDLMNSYPYVNDSRNYGSSDYWATPIDFLENGGDCEDFAIAKYAALRALGVPEERLRLVILQDMQKNIPHAILVVYTDNGPLLLDNQIKTVIHADRVDHYKPIFSINREAWWLHTAPRSSVTIVATAGR